jgi:hypothetical protein
MEGRINSEDAEENVLSGLYSNSIAYARRRVVGKG